ncbi:VOC family protein [Mycolicibacterium baixiangningiae]|uniref:VOC family protein n=1 Tax=Mycolicibacterium baixiangningiae TaxID=2761578 RepID=UPI0018D004CA|nr:VOC family protein [Mycolicibacterium baixiangningiae]
MSSPEGPVGSLASISIDCPDPDSLAPFYRDLLGLEEVFATPDRGLIALSGAGPMVTLMRVDTYVAPSWPDGPQHKQMHLDVAVDDLDTAVAAAVALGATEAGFQPAGQAWRVLLDPVGHPFCLSTVRPD